MFAFVLKYKTKIQVHVVLKLYISLIFCKGRVIESKFRTPIIKINQHVQKRKKNQNIFMHFEKFANTLVNVN